MKSVGAGISQGQPRCWRPSPAQVCAVGRPKDGQGHFSRRCLAGVLFACASQATAGLSLSLAQEGEKEVPKPVTEDSVNRDTPKEVEAPPTFLETEGRVVAGKEGWRVGRKWKGKKPRLGLGSFRLGGIY